MNLFAYLEYLCTHLTRRAPLSTELHGEGLSILGENPHPDRVDQHRHHTQALMLDGVEQNKVPGREKENKQWDGRGGGRGDERGRGTIPRFCWIQLD